MPNTDPIEINFVLNSSELKDEFQTIVSGSKSSDEAVEALKKRFEQLTSAQVLGVKGAEDLTKAIKNISTEAKNTKLDDFGITKKNLQIQKQVIKEIEAEYKKLQASLSQSAPGNAKEAVQKEANAAKRELEREKQALNDLETAYKKQQTETQRLSAQYRSLRDEMRKLQLAGKGNSEEYQELAKRADQYHQAMKQVDAELKVAVSNNSFAGYVQGLSLIAGGFSAVQGVMGLVAGENENLQKIMLKVQSLMAITIGLQQVQEALDKRSAFSIQVLSKANNVLAAANAKLATALGISNIAAKALMGTLTLGLAVAIPVIINLFQKWNSESSKTAELQQDLSSKMSTALAEPLIAYKLLQKEWERFATDLKSKKKFVIDHQDEFKKLGVEVNNVSEAEKILVDKTGNFVEAMRARAKATAAQQLATEKYKEALDKQAELETQQEKAQNGNWLERIWANRFNNFRGSGQFNKTLEDDIKDLFQTFDDLMDQSIDDGSFADKIFEKLGLTKTSSKNEPEFLPPGSVAELKKQIKDIDDALFKAGRGTDDAVIKKLKESRIKAAEELAEAEKRIEIQSVKEAVEARQSAWQQYYAYEAEYGKEAAKRQFGNLQKESSSYFDWLQQQKDGFISLAESGPLTEKQLSDLQVITDKMAELSGRRSDFDNFTNGIDLAIERAPLLADQLSVVNREIEKLADDNRNVDNGKLSFLFAKKEDIQKQLADQAQEFIEAQETIEQQRNAIVEKYAAIREEINKRSDINESEKERLIQASKAVADAEIAQAERAESERNNVFLRYSRNIIAASREELKTRIKSLEEFLEAGDRILTQEERAFVENQIRQSKSVIAMTDSRTKENALLNEKEKILKKIKNLQEGEEGDLPGLLKQLEAINGELNKGEFEKNAKKVAKIAGFVGSQFREMANAIGDSNEGLSDTLEAMADIFGIVEDAAVAAASFAGGNIVTGIASTIKAVGGALSFASKARASRKAAEAEIAKREKEVFQAGLDYNKILRDRLSLESEITEQTKGRLAAIRQETKANKDILSSIERDYNTVFKRLIGSETLVGQHVKKPKWYQVWKSTKVVDEMETVGELLGLRRKHGILGLGRDIELTDEIFDKLQKINSEKPLTGDAKEAYEQLLKLKEEYGSIEKLQAQLAQEVKDTLSGTTRDSIAQSIADGLKQGKRSFADFADDFQGMLENAVISAFVNNSVINEGATQLQKIIKEAMEDEILTDEEAAEIRDYYEVLLGSAERVMNDINNVGLDFGSNNKPSANSLKGAYSTASQESIDLLSGHTAGLRIAVVETNNINKAGFHDLMEAMSRSFQTQLDIERNTRRTATNTETINKTNDKGFNAMKSAYEKNYNALRAAGIIR